jgi:YD repeat-containing protein
MAAIISGNGLGLLNTSLNTIGGQGVSGNGSFGQAGGQAYVNIATGNLVIQSLDQRLAAIGHDIAPVRTYNSQGTMTAGDQWDWEGERRAYSVGTLNASGSKITVVEADGHLNDYLWVSGTTYQSKEGDGAYDTIDTSVTGSYIWTDGSTQLKITYDANNNGRLSSITDIDGTKLLYSYDTNGRLSSIRDNNITGEEVVFSYDSSGRLTGLATKHANASTQNVTYTYDSLGRLLTVTTDLTPQGSTDSQVYTTIYSYKSNNSNDSNRFLIASISQGDGTKVSFNYDSTYRVTSVTDASGVTTYDYDDTVYLGTKALTITNALGERWLYRYNTSNLQLFSLTALKDTAPATSTNTNDFIGRTRFYYDTNGNLRLVTDADGKSVTYRYDDRGNRTEEFDSLGNAVSRTYNANNQVLTEKSYSNQAQLDTDGNWVLPSTGQTSVTNYVYDDNSRLNFVVSPEGRVTRYIYYTSTSVIATTATTATTAGLIDRVATFSVGYTDATYTFAALSAWESGKAYASLSKFNYDRNGNLKRQIDYAVLNSDNVGNINNDDGTRVSDFIYDQYGRLLQQIVRRGSNHTTTSENLVAGADDSVTAFSYDGLGRLLTQVSAQGTTTYTYTANVSSNTINYTGGKIATSNSASGLFTLQSYDSAGRIISLKQSASESMTSNVRETAYTYDSAGRLVTTTLPTGAKVFNFYDLAGRLSGVVDAAGSLTEYVYNANNLLTKEVRYATAVNPYDGSNNLKARVEDVRPADNSKDRVISKAYDAANRLVSITVADKNETAYQYTTTYAYNGLDQLTKVTNGDRITRYFYDGEGRQVAVWDAEGYLTEDIYNPAGQKIRSNRYGDPRTSSTPDTATLAQLRPASDSKVLSSFYFYNKRGQVIGSIDEQQFVTTYTYDEKANTQTTRRYAAAYTATTATLTQNAMIWNTVLSTTNTNSAGKYQESIDTFNAKGQLKNRKEVNGRISTFVYDTAGRLTTATTAAGQGDERQVLNRYNVFGELIATLSGEAAALTTNASDINAIFDKYAIKSFYDAAGRKTHVMDAAGQLTTFYYDAAGRLTHVINADGDVVESGYNVFSELEKTTSFYKSLATTAEDNPDGAAIIPTDARKDAIGVGKQLKGGLLTDEFSKLINGGTGITGIRDNANDQTDRVAYNTRGLVETRTDGEGNVTTLLYNRFGELEYGKKNVTLGTATNTTEVVIRYSYDKRGLLKTQIEDQGTGRLNLQTSREYDAFGRLIKVTDARGKITTTDYSQDKGRKLVITAPNNNVSTTTYDAWGRQLTVNNNGNTTSYVYDDTERTLKVTSPEGIELTTTYNLHGEVVEVKDASGKKTTYTYNRDGQKIKEEERDTQGNGSQATYTYGSLNDAASGEKFGVLKETVNAIGLKVTYLYDYANRVTSRKEYLDDNNYNESSYSFDGQGRQFRVIESSGTSTPPRTTVSDTKYYYDTAGRLEKVIQDPNGLQLQTIYKYDELGQQVEVWQGTMTTPDQQVTRYVYDAAGRRITEIRDPNGLALSTSYRYDANDNVARKIDAAGNSTWYVYDDANNLVYTIDGAGGLVKNVYNSTGQLVASYTAVVAYDALSLVGTHVYSISDIEQSSRTPNLTGAQFNRIVYDKDGRVRYTVDSVGNVTEKTYNSLGQLSATIIYSDKEAGLTAEVLTESAVGAALSGNPVISKSSYFYDSLGRVQYSVDAMGYLTRTYYDDLNHVTATRRFQDKLTVTGSTTTGTINTAYATGKANIRNAAYYDKLGRKIIEVDGEEQVSRYEYNAQGQLIASYKVAIEDDELLDGSSATVENFRSKINGLSADKVAVTHYYYDKAGRQTHSIDALGYVTKNLYDSAGNVIQTIDYAAKVEGTIGDTLPAITATSGKDRNQYFYYDAVGRKVVEVATDGFVTRYDYDAVGNLSAQTKTGKTVIDLLGSNTVADADNLRTAINALSLSSMQVSRYYYDADNRLVYTVDALGYATRNYYYADDKFFASRKYDTALTAVTAFSTTANIADMVSGNNTLNRVYYDAARRKTVEEDAAGYLTRYEYDAYGHVIRLTRVNATSASLVSGTLTSENLQAAINDLKTTAPEKLQTTTYYYDAAGRNTYTVDALGYVSKTVYNDYGQVFQSIKYATALAVVADPAVTPVVTTNSTNDQISTYYYDAAGRLTHSVNALGYVTQNSYDGFGKLIKTTEYAKAVSGTLGSTVPSIVADAVNDRSTTYYYDLQGQLKYTVDAEGYVVRTDYNGFGQMQQTVRYANKASGVTAGLPNVAANSSKDQNTYYYYDLAGRNTYTIDAENGVSRNEYDAYGNVYKQTKYSKPVTATITPPTLPTIATDSAKDQVNYYYYDKLGRLIYQLDAAKYATINKYDGFNLTSSIRLVDVLADPGFSNIKAAESDASNERITNSYQYDRLGQKTKETDGAGYSVSTTYDGFGNAVIVTDKMGNKGYFYYDLLGRNVGKLDPMGHYTSYNYDAFGRQTEESKYGNLTQQTNKILPSGATLPNLVSILAEGDSAPTDRPYIVYGGDLIKTLYQYDQLDRKIEIIDTLGKKEAYEYWSYQKDAQGNIVNDANGNPVKILDNGNTQPTRYKNKLEGWYSYTYDKLGRLKTETLPVKTLNASGTLVDVVNAYDYDAFGNRIKFTEALGLAEQRISVYGYDELNRLTSKTAEQVSMLVFNPDGIAGNEAASTAIPLESYEYDALGNQILKTDANGAKTFSYYDANNRKTHEIRQIDATTGSVSYWEYNAAGQATVFKQYETPRTLPSTAGGNAPSAPSGNIREMRYTYDKVGRQTAVILPAATVYDHDENGTYGLYNSVNLITTTEYDANGNVTQVTDARGNSSYTYYDKIGRKILFVDNENYATRWQYYDADNKQRETRYAFALDSVVRGNLSASDVVNDLTFRSSANDRVTTTTFDEAGRAVKVEVANVAYGAVSGSGTLTAATGTAITLLSYNGLDQVTTKIEAAGTTAELKTQMDYDALGRQVLNTFGEFTDYEGNIVKQRIATQYNGLGLTSKVAILGKDTEFSASNPPATFSTANDRVTNYGYDKLGRVVTETEENTVNINGSEQKHITNYAYDLAGNQTRIGTYRSVNGTPTRKLDETLLAYDMQGHEIARRVQSRNEGAGVTASSVLEQRETSYNSFGEITGKRLVKFDSTTKATDPWHEVTLYNNQGKVWKTNADNGVTRYYVYDRNGNATLQLDSITGDRAIASPSALTTLDTVTYTETHYDKRNQVTEIRQPQFTQNLVDAGINVFEQPVNFQDDVADTFSFTTDDKGFAGVDNTAQQLKVSGLDTSITRVTLYYWPQGSTSTTYNTKRVEMQAVGAGTGLFVVNWGALDTGEYTFKFDARNASGTIVAASSATNGTFTRTLAPTPKTYVGGSVTVNTGPKKVSVTQGTVAADYIVDDTVKVTLFGREHDKIVHRESSNTERTIRYDKYFFVDTVRVFMPASVKSLGTGTFTVEVFVGNRTYTKSNISSSSPYTNVSIGEGQILNGQNYSVKVYKNLPGGAKELVAAELKEVAPAEKNIWKQSYYYNDSFDSPLMVASEGSTVDLKNEQRDDTVKVTPLKQLVINGLPDTTTRVEVEYRLDGATDWGVLDANVGTYTPADGINVAGWYKVDLSALDRFSTYEYRYMAYDANDKLIKGGQGELAARSDTENTPGGVNPTDIIRIENNVLPAMASELVNKPQVVNTTQDEVDPVYAANQTYVGAWANDQQEETHNSNSFVMPLRFSYNFDNTLIRRYGSGNLVINIQSDKTGRVYTTQQFSLQADGTTDFEVQISRAHFIEDRDGENATYSLKLMLVEDGGYTEIANGKESFSDRIIYPARSDRKYLNYEKVYNASTGLKFEAKTQLQVKGQPEQTTRLAVYYREAGSKQAYRLYGYTSPALDAYGVVLRGQFNIDLDSYQFVKDKKYEIQYVAEGIEGVLNRQQGYFKITDSGINVVIAPLNYGGDGFTLLNQSSKSIHFYDIGNYSTATLKYRQKGTSQWQQGGLANWVGYQNHGYWSIPSEFRTGFNGDIEFQIDSYTDSTRATLYNSIVGTVSMKQQADGGSLPVDVSFIPREYSVRTVNFGFQPLDTKTIKLRYGTSSTNLDQTAILLVNSGDAMWDVTSYLDNLPNATATKTVYYELTAYNGDNATGLVLNKASGKVKLGFGGGGPATITALPKDTYVDIQPPQHANSSTRMELYYRLRPTDSTGNFTDLFESYNQATVDNLKLLNFTKLDSTVNTAVLTKNNGAYRWNTSTLIPESGYADYEYFYELYDSSGNSVGFVPGQLHVTATGTGFLKQSKWQVNGSRDESTQIIRSQAYNAFGEIETERDGNDNVTTSEYNTLGKLVAKRSPETNVLKANGSLVKQELVTRYYYDLAGRLVASKDAKGNTTRLAYNGGRDMESGEFLVGTTYQADDSTIKQKYSVYGDLTRRENELGLTTAYVYDKYGNLSIVLRPLPSTTSLSDYPLLQMTANMNQALYGFSGITAESYTYDELGNRIWQGNSVLSGAYTEYDGLGRIIKNTSAGGAVTTTTYTYDAAITGLGGVVNGGTRRTVKDANNKTAIDEIEYFGHTTWHRDLGNNNFTYQYNLAGKLVKQTSSTGQNIDYEYYNNGYQKAVRDNALGMLSEYTYDNNGNMNGERYSEINAAGEPRIYQNAHIQYDELNRKVHVWDEAYSISYEYDENSNVRYVVANYSDGVNGAPRTQNFWYDYDQMNRFTVTMGVFNYTTDRIEAGSTGVKITYDLVGQRKTATYGTNALGTDTAHTERYTYTTTGYLEKIEQTTGSILDETGYKVIATRQNDALGRILNYKTYKPDGNLEQEVISTYNSDNQILTQQRVLGANAGTTTYEYMDDNVTLKQTVFNNQTTKYYYDWWDSAKQSQIRVTDQSGTRRLEGWSDFYYDVNGHLNAMTDLQNTSNQRRVDFVNNSQGMILQRNELINSSLNRYRNFYYVSGQRIGDISNDGPSREDYVTAMATARKPSQPASNFAPVSSADFDQSYEPINPTYPSSAPSNYTVNLGDTLQGIALSIWGDASMWFVLADANGLNAGDALKAGQVLIVPNKVTNIHHNSSTVRPYSPGEAIGDTQPTLPLPPPPPKPKKKCGGIGQIIMIIVAVVVTVVVSMILPAAGSFVGNMLFAAISAAAGSVASQAVGVAIGAVDKFSWSQVGKSALMAAATAGLMQGASVGLDKLASSGALNSTFSSWAATAAKALSSTSSGTSVTHAAIRGAANYGASFIAGQVFGEKQKFSWQGLGASIVGSMASARLAKTEIFDGLGDAADYAYDLVGSNAAAAIEDKWFGGSRPDYVSVSAAAIANTVGRKFGKDLQRKFPLEIPKLFNSNKGGGIEPRPSLPGMPPYFKVNGIDNLTTPSGDEEQLSRYDNSRMLAYNLGDAAERVGESIYGRAQWAFNKLFGREKPSVPIQDAGGGGGYSTTQPEQTLPTINLKAMPEGYGRFYKGYGRFYNGYDRYKQFSGLTGGTRFTRPTSIVVNTVRSKVATPVNNHRPILNLKTVKGGARFLPFNQKLARLNTLSSMTPERQLSTGGLVMGTMFPQLMEGSNVLPNGQKESLRQYRQASRESALTGLKAAAGLISPIGVASGMIYSKVGGGVLGAMFAGGVDGGAFNLIDQGAAMRFGTQEGFSASSFGFSVGLGAATGGTLGATGAVVSKTATGARSWFQSSVGELPPGVSLPELKIFDSGDYAPTVTGYGRISEYMLEGGNRPIIGSQINTGDMTVPIRTRADGTEVYAGDVNCGFCTLGGLSSPQRTSSEIAAITGRPEEGVARPAFLQLAIDAGFKQSVRSLDRYENFSSLVSALNEYPRGTKFGVAWTNPGGDSQHIVSAVRGTSQVIFRDFQQGSNGKWTGQDRVIKVMNDFGPSNIQFWILKE